jgi:hypothetical protein
MIADAGFTVEGADTDALLAAAGVAPAAAAAAADGSAAADDAAADGAATPGNGGRPDLVHVRRRGAGTAIPANT